jgi:hypothetical protein
MFNFDIGHMIVGIALAGAVIGGTIVALVLLAKQPARYTFTA